MKMDEYVLKATVKTLNVKPGGKSVTCMRETEWNGRKQLLYTEDKNGIKTPIGVNAILEKRGLLQKCTAKYSKSGKNIVMREMVEVLSDCEDFRNEKSIVQKIVED